MIPVKICGITCTADALCAAEAGAEAVGFIFYAKSPRYISWKQTQIIARKLPRTLKKVGVFVNHDREYISNAINKVPLDLIQLHGEETPKDCLGYSVPVIKALRIKDGQSLAKMDQFKVKAFLLDTWNNEHYGGSGKTFNWSLIQKVSNTTPLILSGGLNQSNVFTAIKKVSPAALDINSGVETEPGKKDHQEIQKLFEQLKNTSATEFVF